MHRETNPPLLLHLGIPLLSLLITAGLYLFFTRQPLTWLIAPVLLTWLVNHNLKTAQQRKTPWK